MADFLNTEELNLAILNVIKDAKERLILVSPYLKTCERIRKSIEEIDKNGTNIIFVYGKRDLSKDELDWIKTLSNVIVCRINNLHAKCYSNEEFAISTSMNLYEYSQINNYETGIIMDSREDHELFSDLVDYSLMLIRQSTIDYATIECKQDIKRGLFSDRCSLSFAKLSEPIDNLKSTKEETSIGKTVFCIRCGKKISVTDDTLFCKSCENNWAKWKNADYAEKYCYICGKTSSTTVNKPVCKDCYNENRELINSKRSKLL